MPDLQFHEAADIFPLIHDDDLDALADDIAKNGLQIPVETYEGKILDGRNRYRACLLRDVEPDIIEAETDDPIAYVLSMNLHRRHLSVSQLALAADKAVQLRGKLEAAAKDRMKRKPKSAVENSTQQTGAKTRDEIGEAFGISGNSVDKGHRVRRDAIPEVTTAVEAGKLALNRANKIARLPKAEQKPALKEALKPRVVSPRTSGKNNKDKDPELEEGKVNGVGVDRANEAINCLMRIPKNDRLRKRGFQIVTDWIRRNK